MQRVNKMCMSASCGALNVMVWLHFDCANTREGSGKTVNMCRLALDFTASLAYA